MRVLGTAGHVDHGKSALVHALTGINPDRLQEEKDRQMTIDLGFAWMTLPNGEDVGIVDVPGHRDFIENMLAGANGFDAALLVIAADEGIMPQTREHLSILDLLDIQQGVVALTKVDLIDDKEWIELVKEDIQTFLEKTSLSNAAIVPVSVITMEGIDSLNIELERILSSSQPRDDIGKPRLPVDRAFTIAGFGTVVTGTLNGGSFSVGDEVEILPGEITGRIRGLQTHKVSVESAVPGSRVAINISGVDVQRISRGDVISHPNDYSSTTMIDVHYRHLDNIGIPLKHDQKVKIFIGSAQRIARVRLLGMDKVMPGGQGFLQLMVDDAMVAERADHYILRRPSPGLTMGGGRVLDALPQRRYRRFDEEIIQRLESMVRADPQDLIRQSLISRGLSKVSDVAKRTGLNGELVLKGIKELIRSGEILQFIDSSKILTSRDWVLHRTTWENMVKQMGKEIDGFHKRFPLRFGMPREELKSRIGLESQIYPVVLKMLSESGLLEVTDLRVSRKGYEPELSKSQDKLVSSLLARFHTSPYGPPSVRECKDIVGEDLYFYLIKKGRLFQVSHDVVFKHADYQEMVSEIESVLKNRESITVAEVRDLFKTTRKYALALMEHLDTIGVTFREGDVRRLAIDKARLELPKSPHAT